MSAARVTAVAVVHQVRPDPGGEVGVTAIDKRPVEGRVAVGAGGLAGDRQCDRAHHGGTFKAVYAYADEDAVGWAGELGREVPPGLFGENLRTSGVDVTGAVVGERWRVGEGEGALVLEVCSPRIPCATFQRRLGEAHWVKRFTDRGAPGAYLRVLAAGTVAAGDPLVVVHRPSHGVTVGQCFLRSAPADMRALLAAEAAGEVELDGALHAHAARVVGRSGAEHPS